MAPPNTNTITTPEAQPTFTRDEDMEYKEEYKQGEFRATICPFCGEWTAPGTWQEPLMLIIESRVWVHFRCFQRQRRVGA